MRQISWRTLLLAGGFLLAGLGCASRAEWTTWGEHPVHFASGDHLSFSSRNPKGAAPVVTRSDVALAGDEGWWGTAVTVDQEQILER
jgi:hypothetical protein